MKFKSDIEVQAGLKDSSGAAGTSGQVLSSNGTTVSWINAGGGVASDVQNLVKAGVAINKGQAVYVTSADGTNIIVGLASNTSEATSSKTLGLLDATVAINGMANVVQVGRLEGLNTIGANAGDPVWLGANGNLIYGLANKPYAPLHLVYIGVVTRVNANNGEIFINVQNGFELKELHDVSAQTPSNNNGIFYNTSNGLWEAKSISAAGGIEGSGTTNYVPKFTGASTIGNSLIYDNGTNVGIGTTSPTSVSGYGVVSLNGTNGSLFNGMHNGTSASYFGTDSVSTFVYELRNAFLGFGTNGTERMRITSGGNNQYTGDPFIYSNTTAGGTSIHAGLRFNSTDKYIRFFTNDLGRMDITSGGNVLIGTTTDAGYKLDVNGTGRFNQNLTLNRASGGNASGLVYQTGSTNDWYIGSSAVGANTDLQVYNHSAAAVVFNIANTSGNVGIGTAYPTSKLTINQNSSFTGNLSSPTGGGGLHLISNDLASIAVSLDGFGVANSQITFRRANGTLSAPTALTTNSSLGAVTWRGYGTTAYSGGNRGLINVLASENWTDSAQGSYMTFNTVTTGTTSSVERLRLTGDGTVIITNLAGSGTRFVTADASGTLSSTTGGPISGSGSAGQVTFWNGTNSITGESALFWDSTNDRLGIGTASPLSRLHVNGDVRTVLTSGAGGQTLISAINGVSNGYLINVDNSNNITHNWHTGSNATSLYIASNGAIGMNTASPFSSGVLTLQESASLGAALSIRNRNSTQQWDFAVDTMAVDDKFFGIIDRTNLAVRMAIAPNGNVQIGTTIDAGYKFDVSGTGRFTGALTASSVTTTISAQANAILGTVSSSWGGTLYPTLYGSATDRWVMHINPHVSYTQNGVNGFTGSMTGSTVRMASDPAANSYWDIGVGTNSVGTDKFSIGRAGTNFLAVNNSGNVGIGTVNPEQKLHVEGTILLGNQEHLAWAYDNGQYYNYITNFYDNSTGMAFRAGSWTGGNNVDFSFQTHYSGAWNTKLAIKSDGNVGIGTTTPGVKFVNSGGANSIGPSPGLATTGSNAILSGNGLYGLYTGVSNTGHVWQQVQRNDGNTALYPLSLQTTGGSLLVGTYSDNGYKLQVNGGGYYYGPIVNTSNATFGSGANRPVTYDSNGGNFRITGNAGGWSMGYFFDGSSGTYRGGFGALGGNDGLSYYWVGNDYNVPTMVVQPSQGNIGIGTTEPVNKLHIQNGTTANTVAMIQSWGVEAAGEHAGIRFKSAVVAANEYGKGFIAYRNAGTGYGRGDFWFCLNNDTNSLNATLSDPKMVIRSAGNVGIGTTDPTSPLEITNTGGTGGGTSMYINTYSSGKQWGTRTYGIDNGYGIHWSTDVQFSSTWHSAIKIGHGQNAQNPSLQTYFGTQLATSGGNVLIGTTTDAGYKLDVAGSTRISGVLTLPQNPTGTTYGSGVSTSPPYMITQGAGDNDAIRFYSESAATNQVSMVFEINDDIETAGNEWIWRNKKTYGGYEATTPMLLSGAGAATFSSSVTANGVGIFGKQDFSIQGVQRVLILRGEPVSGVYANSSYRFYTTPGALTSAQRLSITAEYNGTESVDLFSLTGTGNVLIGTTTDNGQKFRVVGNANIQGITSIGQNTNGTAVIDAYGSLAYYGCNTASNGMGIGPTGAATFSSTVTATGFFNSSDIRLKEIVDYDYNVSDIKPISYLWKDSRDNKKHVGYSAQEVQKVMPDAVNEDADGMLSVNYIEVLVAKIAELENRIKQLEK